MALTRPTVYNLNTNIEVFNDSITVLNAAAFAPTVDVGFVFNRAHGLVPNAAVYWSESSQSFMYALTASNGAPNTNIAVSSYANVTIGNLLVQGLYWQSNGVAVIQTTNPGIYFGNTTITSAPTLVDTVADNGSSRISWKITSIDKINNNYKASTIDSLNNGSSVYYVEYAVLKSNVSAVVATFTSNIQSGNVNLWAVGDSGNVNVAFEREVIGTSIPSGYVNAGLPGQTGPQGSTGTIANTSSWIITTNSTASTSTTTGALQVAGGAGIVGNVYIGGNVSFASQLNLGPSVGLTNTEAYDLDDISNYTDGISNTFTPTYNGTKVTITNAWNLDVSVNGARQPAFIYNSDLTWTSYALTASQGFCLDYNGNIRFADPLPARSQVVITVKPGTNSQSVKTYPFKPLDIVMGS